MAVYVSDENGELKKVAGNYGKDDNKADKNASNLTSGNITDWQNKLGKIELIWLGAVQGGTTIASSAFATGKKPSNYNLVIYMCQMGSGNYARVSTIALPNTTNCASAGIANNVDGLHSFSIDASGDEVTLAAIGYWNTAGWSSRNGNYEYLLTHIFGIKFRGE